MLGKQRVSLTFHDSVTVKDTVIYLSDIASIYSDSAELVTELSKVKVGNAPPPGYSRFVNIGDFLQYKVYPKFQHIDYNINKKQRITVNTDFIEKKIGDYQDSIQNYIKQHVTWKDGRWRLEIKNLESTWKCFNAPLKVAIEGLKTSNPKGQIKLELVVIQYDKKIKIQVPCKIYVTVPIAVAAVTIPRGKKIDSGNFSMKYVDITNYTPIPFFAAEEINDRVASRTILQGTILNQQLCTALPVINKGDAVSIEMQKGSVRIAVSAMARENGSIGEKIWVENSVTHKLIRVTIKEKNRTVIL